MSEKSCHKRCTHTLCTQSMTVFGVGNVTWNKSRAETRYFPTFFAFIRLLSVNVLLLHSLTTPVVLLSINPHVLTQAHPREKGTSMFVKAIPHFFHLQRFLPA